MQIDTPQLTQILQLFVVALTFASIVGGLLWKASNKIDANTRQTVKDEIKPLADGHANHSARLERHASTLRRHTRSITFLKERTAGLEAKTYDRAPITEADIEHEEDDEEEL